MSTGPGTAFEIRTAPTLADHMGGATYSSRMGQFDTSGNILWYKACNFVSGRLF